MKIISDQDHFAYTWNFDDTVQFEFYSSNKFVLYTFTVPVWLLNSVIEIVANWFSKVKFVSYSRLMAHPLRTSTTLK